MHDSTKKVLVLGAIVLVAAMSRLIPHPMNFAPLGAMALFGGAYFGRKSMGLLMVMGAWLLSDLVLNNLVYASQGFTLFTEGAVFIYGSIALIFALGTQVLKKVSVLRVLIGSLSASVIFFIVSNLGVWAQGLMYPMTIDGLTACYVAALPFFQNTVMGDLVYSAALLLVYERLLRAQLIPGRRSVD